METEPLGTASGIRNGLTEVVIGPWHAVIYVRIVQPKQIIALAPAESVTATELFRITSWKSTSNKSP